MNRRDALRQLAVLAGGSVASSVVRAALAGTPLHVPPDRSSLDPAERHLVAELAELIIPATDTPGAIEAGVPVFIDHIVSAWYTERERQIFRDGLRSIDTYCVTTFGRNFLRCDGAQRTKALQVAETDARSFVPKPGLGGFAEPEESSPFFYKIKELTVLGYYTSEVGATQELVYNPIPARYEGDFDFVKVGRLWSS